MGTATYNEWDAIIAALPGAHFLQTQEWAGVKVQTGWQPLYLIWQEGATGFRLDNWHPGISTTSAIKAAALVLQRSLPIRGFAARLRLLYCPKGPLLDWSNEILREQVLQDLERLARARGAIFVKIDPDVPVGYGAPGSPQERSDPLGKQVIAMLNRRGWLFSSEQIQFRNTVLVDLTGEEEDLLQRMKQKTRYNIRLAMRKGVIVRPAALADLELLYRMYAETAVRDGFVIRPASYYYDAWKTFFQAGMGEGLIAEVEGEPVAALVLFRFAGRGWYVYGMSRELHRDKMPNYLLQWEAMRSLRAEGCQVYDLWGAPNDFSEGDPLWGVYRFKEGLGGEVQRNLGAWDLPTRPFIYRLYVQVLPRLLAVWRRHGKVTMQRSLTS